MQKNYFHNSKNNIENKIANKKVGTQFLKAEAKNPVDINILLNRVRLEKKNEIRRKAIFFSFVSLAIILLGSFVAIIK